MKVTQPTGAFSPVVLTLETQAEVDSLFSVFAHRKISNAALDGAFGDDAFQSLEPYVSVDGWRPSHLALCKICN